MTIMMMMTMMMMITTIPSFYLSIYLFTYLLRISYNVHSYKHS